MSRTAMKFEVVLQADTSEMQIDGPTYARIVEALQKMRVMEEFVPLFEAYTIQVTHVEGTEVATHHETCKHGSDVHDGCFSCHTVYAPDKCPDRVSTSG